MKSVVAVFTNQRIIFIEIKSLLLLEEFPLDHFVNVSFSRGSFIFTSVEKKRMTLMVEKSDIEVIHEIINTTSIGTLSEKDFRKAKSQERKQLQ
jgi:hypothetical protein